LEEVEGREKGEERKGKEKKGKERREVYDIDHVLHGNCTSTWEIKYAINDSLAASADELQLQYVKIFSIIPISFLS
jgi:hypothetical protein